MIKRTLYFGNPAVLSLKYKQLVVRQPSDGDLPEFGDDGERRCITIPIEDIGVVVLDSQQLTISQALMSALLDNSCAVIVCDNKRMPSGLMLPLSGHTLQSERFRDQIEASLPLRKQLWQQTIEKKISNQEALLRYTTGVPHPNMTAWSQSVRSGDSDNLEARAAVYYWKTIFPDKPFFVRDHEEDGVNALFNYGYAILRAIVARALVIAGMLPTFGIHHHNRYNAYCLADDIMEPYRPYVDRLVYDIVTDNPHAGLTREVKAKLLSIATCDVVIDSVRHPLMVAASVTASSLGKCFRGESRKIAYPQFE